MTNDKDNQAIVDRIDRLEAENRALKAQLATMQGPAKPRAADLPSARAFEEPGASVTNLPIFSASFEMPTPKQFGELHLIVQGRYPKFGIANIPPEEFRRAFIFTGNCVRLDVLAEDKTPSWWEDAGEEWLKKHSLPGAVYAAGVTAAILAHADIRFSDLHRWPFDSKFGLALPGYQGRPATNKWKNLLNGGRLLEPFKKYPWEQTIIRPEGGHHASLTR